MTEKTDPIMSIALPDARILTDDRGRLLYLSGPTDTYDHGVLGDSIEASSISLVGDPKTGEAKVVIKMPENLVIEGISPIWSDLDRDGSNEIIVTASNTQQGSQFLVYEENGQLLAEGPAIGQGYRWRHQIATAPFGPNGELELVGVRTPHLGGVVEFYQLIDEKLVIVAQLPGYTSHVIGSRNLDMAGAGDFDSDGHVELLLPNQSRSKIAAIRRVENGADEVWSVHLESPMTTNLGAVTLFSGNIALGIGQENGILRIWHP